METNFNKEKEEDLSSIEWKDPDYWKTPTEELKKQIHPENEGVNDIWEKDPSAEPIKKMEKELEKKEKEKQKEDQQKIDAIKERVKTEKMKEESIYTKIKNLF